VGVFFNTLYDVCNAIGIILYHSPMHNAFSCGLCDCDLMCLLLDLMDRSPSASRLGHTSSRQLTRRICLMRHVLKSIQKEKFVHAWWTMSSLQLCSRLLIHWDSSREEELRTSSDVNSGELPISYSVQWYISV